MQDPDRLDQFLRQLDERLLKSTESLTPEEIDALRSIAEYREEIVAQFRYSRARRIIFKEWRSLIVGIAALLALIVSLRDDAISVLKGLVQK